MTWCHVRGHAICCRCDGSPETSDATLVERLREAAQCVEVVSSHGVLSIELLEQAADRIEALEELVESEGL